MLCVLLAHTKFLLTGLKCYVQIMNWYFDTCMYTHASKAYHHSQDICSVVKTNTMCVTYWSRLDDLWNIELCENLAVLIHAGLCKVGTHPYDFKEQELWITWCEFLEITDACETVVSEHRRSLITAEAGFAWVLPNVYLQKNASKTSAASRVGMTHLHLRSGIIKTLMNSATGPVSLPIGVLWIAWLALSLHVVSETDCL